MLCTKLSICDFECLIISTAIILILTYKRYYDIILVYQCQTIFHSTTFWLCKFNITFNTIACELVYNEQISILEVIMQTTTKDLLRKFLATTYYLISGLMILGLLASITSSVCTVKSHVNFTLAAELLKLGQTSMVFLCFLKRILEDILQTPTTSHWRNTTVAPSISFLVRLSVFGQSVSLLKLQSLVKTLCVWCRTFERLQQLYNKEIVPEKSAGFHPVMQWRLGAARRGQARLGAARRGQARLDASRHLFFLLSYRLDASRHFLALVAK